MTQEMDVNDIEANLKAAERIHRVIQKWRISDDLYIHAKARSCSLTPVQLSFQRDNILCHLFEAERNIVGVMKQLVSLHPLWKTFLRHVIGIGPSISAQLIGEIDMSRTPHPSSLWAYAGLQTCRVCTSCGFSTRESVPGRCPECGEGRVIGSATNSGLWGDRGANLFLKTVTYRASLQFLKSPRSFYRSVYDRVKRREERKNIPFMLSIDMAYGYLLAEEAYGFMPGSCIKKKPGSVGDADFHRLKKCLGGDGEKMVLVRRSKNHIHFRSLRIVRKLFLSHVFEMWLRSKGLEYPGSYAIRHLGRSFVITPDEVICHDSHVK